MLMWLPWLLAASPAAAWYLPGIAPAEYQQGDEVPLLVNRLTSQGSSDESSLLGFDYYHPHFKFCEPEEGKRPQGGSLGAILFGDRIYNSPFKLNMLEDVQCRHVCQQTYTPQDSEFVARRVLLGYNQHWLLDALPVSGIMPSSDEIYPTPGFPLGEVADRREDYDVVELYNHYDFIVEYHHPASGGYRVVGASVIPGSRNNLLPGQCDSEDDIKLKSDSVTDVTVPFTYSVTWKQSDIPWATRWDRYLRSSDSKINWVALANTTLVVFLLVAIAWLTLTRLLRRDIAHYNELDLGSEDIPDDNGWKMVSGDVFRAPRHVQTYAIAVGSGVQMLMTTIVTLTLAMLGFLSPANRGAFPTMFLLLNTVLGALGGYASAKTYKTWGGDQWKLNLLLTPTVLPALVFTLFVCLNMLLVLANASGAVPLGNMVALVAIWGLISVPMSFAAGFMALRKAPEQPPIRVNQIPRQVPPEKWYVTTPGAMLVGGIIPFLAVALQLQSIFSTIWFGRIYYMFGFLFASILAMVCLSAACSALSLYLTLSGENHRWHWRSFCVAGSPACFIFLYSLWYLVRYVKLHFVTGRLLYVVYSLVGSFLVFLALGSVGAITCNILVRKIYASIKVD